MISRQVNTFPVPLESPTGLLLIHNTLQLNRHDVHVPNCLEKLSFQQGQQGAVSMLSGEVRGKAVGIAPSGALILETMTGERKEILSGDVQVRKS